MSMESLENLMSGLDKIQGLSAAALVFCCCIVTGYILRFIRPFPNEGIPVVSILMGGLAMMMLADPRASAMPARVWTSRNLIVGLTIGFIAWMAHKTLLSKLEAVILRRFDKAARFLGGKDGTDFLKKTDVGVKKTETKTEIEKPKE